MSLIVETMLEGAKQQLENVLRMDWSWVKARPACEPSESLQG